MKQIYTQEIQNIFKGFAWGEAESALSTSSLQLFSSEAKPEPSPPSANAARMITG